MGDVLLVVYMVVLVATVWGIILINKVDRLEKRLEGIKNDIIKDQKKRIQEKTIKEIMEMIKDQEPSNQMQDDYWMGWIKCKERINFNLDKMIEEWRV